jgi:translation initiation factor 1 (eIF-1/SUI1)
MARKKKTKIDFSQDQGFGQSVGQGLGLKLDAVSLEQPLEELHPLPIEPMLIRLSVSRKGYGGKTVTECAGFNFLGDAQRAEFTQKLTKLLGTRAFWKDGLLCLQGDHRVRLKPYLESLNHTVR